MIDATLPRGLPYPQVATSVPFTFRDGLTTLELIERLRRCLGGLQADVNTMAEQLQANIEANTASIEQLRKDFEDGYKAIIERWLGDNLPQYVYDYITDAIRAVFFGLTDDGYFVAYVPNQWARYIAFDTGADYNEDDYGHLKLEY